MTVFGKLRNSLVTIQQAIHTGNVTQRQCIAALIDVLRIDNMAISNLQFSDADSEGLRRLVMYMGTMKLTYSQLNNKHAESEKKALLLFQMMQQQLQDSDLSPIVKGNIFISLHLLIHIRAASSTCHKNRFQYIYV